MRVATAPSAPATSSSVPPESSQPLAPCRQRRWSRRHRFGSIAVGLAVALTACSSGSDAPTVVDGRSVGSDDGSQAAEPASPSPAGLVASPAQVFGHGRARIATVDADTLVVATTIGLYVTSADGGPITPLDTFDPTRNPRSLAIAPDGQRLAIGFTAPPAVALYDLSTNTRLSTQSLPPTSDVIDVSFTSDSKTVLVDTPLGPMAWQDPQVPPVAIVDPQPTGRPSVLPDGRIIVPIAGTTNVVTTTTAGGATTAAISLAEGATVHDSAAAPSGSLVALTAGVGDDMFERQDSIVIIDPATLATRATITTDVVLDPTGWGLTDTAVGAVADDQLLFWTPDGAPISAPTAVAEPAVALRVTAAGFVSVHRNGAMVLWAPDLQTFTVIDDGGVTKPWVEVDSLGRFLTGVDLFGRVVAWTPPDTVAFIDDNRFGVGEFSGVAINSQGTQLGASSNSGMVTLMDSQLAPQWAFQPDQPAVRVDSVAFDPALGSLVTGLAQRIGDEAFDDTVTSWNTDTEQQEFTFGGEGEPVPSCAFFYSRMRFTADGSQLAAASHDFTVVVVDGGTGDLIATLPAGATSILDMAYSPDDQWFVATYEDSSVRVWKRSDYSLAYEYTGGAGGFSAIAVAPGSNQLITVDITGAIVARDLATGAEQQVYEGAAARTTTLALSADGTLLAAPVNAADIGIWSTASGRQLATIAGHQGAVTGLAFAPDNTWLASSSADGTVRTWALDAS